MNAHTEQGFPEFQLGENVSVYLLTDWSRSARSSPRRTRRTSRCACPTCTRRASELEAKGVEFDGEMLDTTVCHMAFFRDPDGNALMLHRRYAPPKS